MRRNALETIIGALVIAVAIGFVGFCYTKVEVGSSSGYEVFARFDRADGLKEGADVRMSGIRVGQIKSLTLDKETFLAVVAVVLDETVALPDDSSAEIVSESLLGGRFLNLTPGGSEKNITAGGEIRYTQSPVSLEQMLGKFIFNANDGDAKK
jgi:phospholipid/cholesterol/gamma-HCH transport system substrate-binding protein